MGTTTRMSLWQRTGQRARRRKKRRGLRLFMQAVLQVTINWAQSISILMSDLSLPESVLPLLSTLSVVRTTTSDRGVGFECIDGLESFHAQYQVMMIVPVVVIGLLIVLFSIKFAIRYRAKKAKHDEQDAKFNANTFALEAVDGTVTGSGTASWTTSLTRSDWTSQSTLSTTGYSSM